MFLIILALYIIIFRKLIFTLSRKYPKFYQQERKHIISTISIILASIGMRIVKFGLFSIDSFNKEIQKSYNEFTWLYPLTILVFLCTTTLMQISAVLF